MKKKICIISTSRADYSFLKPLVITFKKEKKFKTIFLVTGTHLVKKYGYSIKEIIKDKLKIDKKMSINLGEKSSSKNTHMVQNAPQMAPGLKRLLQKTFGPLLRSIVMNSAKTAPFGVSWPIKPQKLLNGKISF